MSLTPLSEPGDSSPDPGRALPPPIWIATPADLKALIEVLSRQTRLAVDTESNSLHAYRERVCLIQFSTPQADYLVDPLALDDLSPLGTIFADPRIEKVFHAVEYDLLCLRRDFHFTFASVFDTMHAARVLGHPKVGLNALLKHYFGIHIDKHFQKADWGKRPLPAHLQEYAYLDTHYLLPLRDRLYEELRASERLSLAQEDFRRACKENTLPPQQVDPGDLWKRFAQRRDLSRRDLTILRQLLLWREHTARRLNRPPFKVIGDHHLIKIARARPHSKTDLACLGLSKAQIARWGTSLLEAVAQGRNAPLVQRQPSHPPDETRQRRLEALQTWRRQAAQEMGVESDIILPRAYLLPLAMHGPQAIASILADSPTRLERFGLQIMHTLEV